MQTEIKASLKYFRVSPRKVRLAATLIKGMLAEKAIKQLSFTQKRSSPALVKLLKSAISNAKVNFHLASENLYIKEIRVDEGPTLKRHMPRAFGRASAIRKRSSHISVVLEEFQPKAGSPRAKKPKSKKS